MPGLDAPSLLAIQQRTIQTAARVSFTPWDWKLVMRRLLITNLSHMRRSDCNLPLACQKILLQNYDLISSNVSLCKSCKKFCLKKEKIVSIFHFNIIFMLNTFEDIFTNKNKTNFHTLINLQQYLCRVDNKMNQATTVVPVGPIRNR